MDRLVRMCGAAERPWRRPAAGAAIAFLTAALLAVGLADAARAQDPAAGAGASSARPAAENAAVDSPQDVDSHGAARQTLVVSITIFVLAVFVGFEVINKVPATLHTPLMSGSNAISGITVVGALVVAGHLRGAGPLLGFVAVVLAMINVVGGFLVTQRMLQMFKRR